MAGIAVGAVVAIVIVTIVLAALFSGVVENIEESEGRSGAGAVGGGVKAVAASIELRNIDADADHEVLLVVVAYSNPLEYARTRFSGNLTVEFQTLAADNRTWQVGRTQVHSVRTGDFDDYTMELVLPLDRIDFVEGDRYRVRVTAAVAGVDFADYAFFQYRNSSDYPRFGPVG